MNPQIKLLSCVSLVLLLVSVPAFAQKPDLVVQTGHSGDVRSVAFSPDGKTLASGSSDWTLTLWDVTTGTQLRTLKHSRTVTDVAFSPNGQILASSSTDKTIKLWDVTTGAERRSFAGHDGEVYTVAFSPDGKTLASGSFDRTVRLWDVATGRQLRVLVGHDDYVSSVAFSPDGRTLASGGGLTINLWNVALGEPRSVADALPRAHFRHSSRVTSIAFSPDGKTLASGSSYKTVKLWDAATGAQLQSFDAHNDSVRSVVFSRDGKTLATGSHDRTIKLWDVTTGAQRLLLEGHAGWVTSVAFGPDGKTLASGSSDTTIKLWNVATGGQIRSFQTHSSSVLSVAFSPDGKTLATGSRDNIVRLWDLTTGGQLRSLAGHSQMIHSVAFTPDGKTLATGSNDQTIKLWDMTTGAQLRSLDADRKKVLSVAISPDGRTLAGGIFGGIDGKTIRLWDLATGTQKLALAGHTNQTSSVAFSPDGKILASGGVDETSKLWDVETGALLRSMAGPKHFVNSVAFSPDGKTLAGSTFDGTVKLWDVASGDELRSLDAHSLSVNSVAFSPDGNILASGSADRVVKLWDVATGALVRSLEGDEWVEEIAFSPDGRTLASGRYDGKTVLWEIENGRELVSLIAIDDSDWLVVLADGLFDSSPAAWRNLIWRAQQNTYDYVPVEAYFSDFYYPGLLADILAGKRPQAPTKLEDKDRRQPQVKLLSAEPLSPPANSAVNQQEAQRRYLRVRVGVAEAPATEERKDGSGARDVRLFRDGTLVKIWRGDVLQGRPSAILEASLPIVAGENRLTAYAFNRDNVKSTDATLVVTGENSLKREGTAHVLAIGVNEYANPQYNLKYAVADAQGFAEEFKRQQESLAQYGRVEIIPLLDKKATKANILRALTQLTAKVQPEDAVIVYFAGHGTAHRNQFYLIPHDLGYNGARETLDEAGLKSILTHGISDRELEEAFEKVDAGKFLLVIDACNSGQALEAEEKRRGPMNSKGLAQLAYEKGMYILTAAQSYQEALGSGKLGHGYLTYALVEEGLKSVAADSEPKDGRVLLREWLDYATDRVPQMQEERDLGERRLLVQGRETGRSSRKEKVQRPRVFYRRELEAQSLIIARPATAQPQRKSNLTVP